MRVILILAVSVVGPITSLSPNDPALKEKVMFYMPSLLVPQTNNLFQFYGMNLIKYGYIYSNCDRSHIEYEADEAVKTENKIYDWKTRVHVKNMMSTFYEYYIRPQGEDDGLILWYNLVLFYQNYQLDQPYGDFYTIKQYRGCPVKGEYCDRTLPRRPSGFKFTERQCKKVSLFIKDMAFRYARPVINFTPSYTIPFDYYSIGIYLAEKFPIDEKHIVDLAKEKTFLGFKDYVRGQLQLDRFDCVKKYSTFLAYRNEKEALLEADLKEASDDHTRKVREERLHFHQTVTKMMVEGWGYVNK